VALAAFGVAVITSALVAQRRWLALHGGTALLALGLRTLFAKPVNREVGSAPAGAGLAADYVMTLGLTLANPATILALAAVFAGLPGDQGQSGRGGAAGPWRMAGLGRLVGGVGPCGGNRPHPRHAHGGAGDQGGAGLATLAFRAAAIVSAVSGYR
jgi:hypothetical protein